MQAGPLRIVADDSAALDDVEADETILWIARETADVTGSLVVAEATHMRVVFVDPADVPTVHADLEAQRFPSIRDAHSARSPRPR